MTHFGKLEDAHLEQPSMVTIGVFDGVHRGHQYLIKRLVDEAHRMLLSSDLLPHPTVRGLRKGATT
jgi:riboflavin kinase/FMN adenylyltransferase